MSPALQTTQNHILDSLDDDVQQRLFPHIEEVHIPLGKVLYEPGDRMRYVYFPTDSIVSLLYVMESGSSAEISVVGKEGVVGIALFMGGESTSSRAIVQSGGKCYRLLGQKLVDEFNRHGQLMSLVLRYTQALITQMAQTAVCNRHHTIDQQLCRWLLLSLDRLPTNHLVMTQELIANMLGVRREGVTEAARKLQKAGVIEYRRGHIEVIDRPRLEQLSCECYAVVKRETDRLQKPSSPPLEPSRGVEWLRPFPPHCRRLVVSGRVQPPENLQNGRSPSSTASAISWNGEGLWPGRRKQFSHRRRRKIGPGETGLAGRAWLLFPWSR